MSDTPSPVHKQIDEVQDEIQRLEAKKNILIGKGLTSDSPDDVIKANGILKDVHSREDNGRKSMIIDPNEFSSSFGYKDRSTNVSYGLLHNMAATSIVDSIIITRTNQIASFCQPQQNKYSLGFVIKKRTPVGVEEEKVSRVESREILALYDFMENCGDGFTYDGENDFDSFIRKIIRDSYEYDQMTFEVIPNKKGKPHSFHATDASTMRIADSFDDKSYQKYMSQRYGVPNTPQSYNKAEQINGYYPSYVQVYNDQPIAEFYPWEMCFGVRNPSSSIRSFGYGITEIEKLVKTITSMLWGEEYNRRFFKQGSVPRGLLKVSGSIPQDKLNEFKQQWNATMRGVYNAWRTPILEAEKVDWVDFQKSNRDMEWSNWMEFQIKIASAIFLIDPAEVNFPLQGSSNQSFMFEGSNEARLKHSKDRGLYPVLKFLQKKINRYLIHPKSNGKYEFQFTGLDSMTPKEELEMNVKEVQNFKTVNEVREQRGLKTLGDEGDMILNSVFLQNKQMMEMGGEEDGYQEPEEDGDDVEQAENPFEKALDDYIKTI